MPRISIVMPLYNAEKYLEESLDCVFDQTFADFELICVNDASSDNTMNILQKYQKKDARLTILENEERSGAAYSRNKGMEKASGKYLMFLDGDDVFDEEMLALSFEAAERNCTDVLMFSYKHVSSNEIYNKQKNVHGRNYIDRYCKQSFTIEQCKPYEFLLWATSPCNKMYKREFVLKNNLLFQSLPNSNDVYFVNMALLLSERTIVLNDNRVMVYARDHAEPSRISIKRDPMCCYQAYAQLLDVLIQRGRLDKLGNHFLYEMLYMFIYAVRETKDKKWAREFYEYLQKEGIPQILKRYTEYVESYDDYIDFLLREFAEKSYETAWFDDECFLKIYLYHKRNEFKAFWGNEESKLRVAIWGAGMNGKTALRASIAYSLPIRYIVDISKEKQGTYIENYCVVNPESIMGDVDVILVATQGVAKEVCEYVNQYSQQIQIIDLPGYFAIS